MASKKTKSSAAATAAAKSQKKTTMKNVATTTKRKKTKEEEEEDNNNNNADIMRFFVAAPQKRKGGPFDGDDDDDGASSSSGSEPEEVVAKPRSKASSSASSSSSSSSSSKTKQQPKSAKKAKKESEDEDEDAKKPQKNTAVDQSQSQTSSQQQQQQSAPVKLDKIQLDAFKYSVAPAKLSKEDLESVVEIVERHTDIFADFHEVARIIANSVAKVNASQASSSSSSSSSAAQAKKAAVPQGDAIVPEGKCLETLKDISFVMPRKKLDVEFYKNVIVVKNGKDGKVEASIAVGSIKLVLCVPAADLNAKKKSLTVVIFAETTQSETEEAVAVYTIPMPEAVEQATRPYTALGLSVTVGNTNAFKSSKGEAFVPCNVKNTKDGFLYLLPEGLLFGFKKPLIWIDLFNLENLNFESVTTRTFAINITTKNPPAQHVFSMIDEKEMAGITAYVKTLKTRLTNAAKEKEEKKTTTTGKGKEESRPDDYDSEDEDEDYQMRDSDTSESDGDEGEDESGLVDFENYNSEEDETFTADISRDTLSSEDEEEFEASAEEDE